MALAAPILQLAPHPSRNAGFCPFIMGGDFNLSREPLKDALRATVVEDNCSLTCLVLGTMAGMSNLTTEQVMLTPKIIGPDN